MGRYLRKRWPRKSPFSRRRRFARRRNPGCTSCLRRRRFNPLLTKDRKKAYLGGVDLKSADTESIDKNFLNLGPFGPAGSFLGFHPETYVLYFMINPEEDEQTLVDIIRGNTGKDEQFPIFPERRAIGGPGTISMFWKSSKGKRRFLKAIAGAVQYILYPEEDIVMVTHMAAKRGWGRRGVNSAMISYLQRIYPERRIVYHDLTDQGRKFMESFGGEEWRPNPTNPDQCSWVQLYGRHYEPCPMGVFADGLCLRHYRTWENLERERRRFAGEPDIWDVDSEAETRFDG